MAVAELLHARGLERRHGERIIVALDELRLERGTVLALLGPNGAGKSTLLRLLLGLERPDAGTLLLDGRPVRWDDAELRRRCAATLQRPTLFSGSVLDNARFGPSARGVPRERAEAQARRALEGMGAGHLATASARRLSGGEAQRVAVARALAVAPDILGLDEPTAGLDIAGQREFRQRLESMIRSMAGAALLVTHDPADAFALADRILVLEGGRVTQEGTPEELVASPASPFIAAFTGAELLLDGVVDDIRDDIATVRLAGGDPISATVAPAAGVVIAGSPVHIAYRPEDVLLLGAEASEPVSARNRFRLRVGGMTPLGGLLRVRLEGATPLVALITRSAATDLRLAPGVDVTALVKATALRAYPAAREGAT
ncbi:MAG TPA: ABC transporter ATP-binding protein [Longimicrobiales bacterium]|nr:ABC transporter ATP-binding protein [Longimicrobiales bacterium]